MSSSDLQSEQLRRHLRHRTIVQQSHRQRYAANQATTASSRTITGLFRSHVSDAQQTPLGLSCLTVLSPTQVSSPRSSLIPPPCVPRSVHVICSSKQALFLCSVVPLFVPCLVLCHYKPWTSRNSPSLLRRSDLRCRRTPFYRF